MRVITNIITGKLITDTCISYGPSIHIGAVINMVITNIVTRIVRTNTCILYGPSCVQMGLVVVLLGFLL